MRRFGYAIRTGGDPEIARALASGISRGTRDEITDAASEAVMRVTVHRGRDSEYWETKITEARFLYDTPEPPRILQALLVCYGFICYWVSQAFHAQELVLGKRRDK